jgi:Phage tail tube protein, GTA-gp10
MQIVCEWAGKDRAFALSFGGVLDLEEAAGEPIGLIFQRIRRGDFRAACVYHTIRLALIGGGMPAVEAKALLADRFDAQGYMTHVVVALEVLTALMAGVEPGKEAVRAGEPERIRFSEVSQVCRTFNLSPIDLRAMRFADFANMMTGFNANSDGKKADPLTEDQFAEMMEKYHDPSLTVDGADVAG